jgi:hypothetical protein
VPFLNIQDLHKVNFQIDMFLQAYRKYRKIWIQTLTHQKIITLIKKMKIMVKKDYVLI